LVSETKDFTAYSIASGMSFLLTLASLALSSLQDDRVVWGERYCTDGRFVSQLKNSRPIKKWTKDLKTFHQKRYRDGKYTYDKMFHIICH